MKKISIVQTSFFALLAMFSSFTFAKSAFAEIMIFVGDGCPHCVNVENFVTENDAEQKLGIKYYEVWYHPENQSIYKQKAAEVGYNEGKVPLLIDGSHYEVGDSPIIAYLGDLLSEQSLQSAEILQKDAQPASLSTKDSEELNSIIKDKVSSGEKSEIKNPETLYDKSQNKFSWEKLGEPPYLYYYIAVWMIFMSITIFLISKKRKKNL